MAEILPFLHPGYDGKGILPFRPFFQQLFHIQVILLDHLYNAAGHAEHVRLALAEMDFGIAHLVNNGLDRCLYLFPWSEFDGGYQLCLILAVKLELSAAHRLHVIDIDGASAAHNGFISKGIHSRLIGTADIGKLLASVPYADGDGHLQDLPGFLAHITQHIDQSGLAVFLINCRNDRDLRLRGAR